ncbi:MAG: hypothetical protein Q8P18_25675 [Pseudomonadota bacterium]|nr:hypothetical protein [Pseudomonadota bacterium]
MFLLLLCSHAFAEDLWALAPVEGVRWPDVTTVSVTLTEADRIEVLVRDGEKVRVRKGTDFGWVAASALTDVEPVKPAVEGGDDEMPSFTIPGAEEAPPAPEAPPTP